MRTIHYKEWKEATKTLRMGCRNNADHADVCRKKEDGNLPLGAATMPTMPAARTIMGCHARPGFLVREAGNLEQLLCTLFQIQSAIGQDSRDAELVSFPAFECCPGWSIFRISVLLSLINI